MMKIPWNRIGLSVLVAAVVGVISAAPAAAAPGDGGWVRLTHLSPDTPSVDVRLTSASDSRSVLELSDVGYGDVSDYTRVPAGTYTASMVPAGGGPDDPPAITRSVTVTDGAAFTVAAVGRNAELTGTVLTDDLTVPPPGQARARLLQASVSQATVTVTAVDGPVLARDADFGTATGYAGIPAGQWALSVTVGTQQVASAVDVQLPPGSVNTLVVLDRPDGSVTVQVVQDAAGAGVTPTGGVETGGGGVALPAAHPAGAGFGAIWALVALIAAGIG